MAANFHGLLVLTGHLPKLNERSNHPISVTDDSSREEVTSEQQVSWKIWHSIHTILKNLANLQEIVLLHVDLYSFQNECCSPCSIHRKKNLNDNQRIQVGVKLRMKIIINLSLV